MSIPSLAIAEVIIFICMGVTAVAPCPMDSCITSPTPVLSSTDAELFEYKRSIGSSLPNRSFVRAGNTEPSEARRHNEERKEKGLPKLGNQDMKKAYLKYMMMRDYDEVLYLELEY